MGDGTPYWTVTLVTGRTYTVPAATTDKAKQHVIDRYDVNRGDIIACTPA